MSSFPIPAAELSGLYVLLIVIPRDALRDAYFYVGTAVWDRRSIFLIDDAEQRLVRVPVEEAAVSGFDPAILPDVIVPHVFAELSLPVAEIEACVAVFSETAPAGAHAVRNAFWGLAERTGGAPILVEGNPLWRLDDPRE